MSEQNERFLCRHGFLVIDGWHYTPVGMMIFPTNKRCEDAKPLEDLQPAAEVSKELEGG
jgi:hypothetical protein